jgi:hypothetical protein
MAGEERKQRIGPLKTAYGTELRKVPGARATLTIEGNSYAYAENYDFSEEYEKLRDPVGGTNAPLLTAGTFMGDFNGEFIYTTDFPTDWMTLSSGDLPTKTITMPLQDVQSSPVTKTGTISNAKFFKWGGQKRRHNLFRVNLSASYPAPATWS